MGLLKSFHFNIGVYVKQKGVQFMIMLEGIASFASMCPVLISPEIASFLQKNLWETEYLAPRYSQFAKKQFHGDALRSLTMSDSSTLATRVPYRRGFVRHCTLLKVAVKCPVKY